MFCVGLAGQGMICLAQKTSTENRSSEITWGGGWLPESEKRVDEYAAFRGVFTLNRSTKLRVEILGAHWFQSWIDEQFLTDGPARFPLGWSHCHVWASSPTAQLSKYVLGISPCFGRGRDHFEFCLVPGKLEQGSGRVPFPNDSGTVNVQWHREKEGQIAYEVQSSKPIWMHAGGSSNAIRIEGKSVLPIQRQGNVWILKKEKE
jgi:hypothetical protein